MIKTKKKVFLLLTAIVLTVSLAALCACEGGYYEKPVTKYKKGQEFLSGFGTDNGGYDKFGDEVERLTAIRPSERQLNFAEIEYYNFIHYGMNTFTDAEWGTGKESPSDFDPTNVDTDQWCETLKASGSKGIIFTAKHHDGFCLWQTETTEHSIKNSPYKDGKGDIVKELSDNCRKYGLLFGIYLSPWDMNAESFGKIGDADGHGGYNEFYKAQLTELLDGRYGDIFCVWMDGAGNDKSVDEGFKYDIEGYEEIMRRYQPDCVSANQGSDVRWIGNEAGKTRESEWSVISTSNAASDKQQENAEDAERLQSVRYDAMDRGSRELLAKYRDLAWKPAEADVSIRDGWFYHKDQRPKSVEKLLEIYYKTVGGNASLLLNVPPNREGVIDAADVKVLREFGERIAATKAKPIEVQGVSVGDLNGMTSGKALGAVLDDGYAFENGVYSTTSYTLKENEFIIDLDLGGKRKVGRFDIREDQRQSQRIERFEVWAMMKGGWKLIGDSTNVGNRRTLLFKDGYETSAIRVVIKQSRGCSVIRSITCYEK